MKKITRNSSSHGAAMDSDWQSSLFPGATFAPLSKYPHRLSMYDLPPDEELGLEELERLALDRLHLLRAIETATIRQLKDEDYNSRLKAIEDKYLPLHSNEAYKGYALETERRRDYLSHYILRLGFCMKEETRRWFVNFEALLFKWRYQNERQDEKLKFMQACLPNLSQVSDDEKMTWQAELAASSGPNSLHDVFYKVPFENVCDLVSRRAVFLSEGFAYVPRSESFSILFSLFKSRLEEQLEEASRALPKLNEEDRLLPILLGLCRADDASEPAAMGIHSAKLNHDEIDKASSHFAPCMGHLHQKLKEDAHLKHGGRMQYGLYLKSIGVSLEEALLFWKKAFSKRTTDDQFQKNYLYNIRHNYGQEGKRANYAPYSCHKIITTNPPYGGDHHGCPFKHFSADHLTTYLSQLRLPGAKLGEKALTPAGVREIMDLTAQHHYQIACTRLFELSRKIPNKSAEVVTYPHQFYEWSLQGTIEPTAIAKESHVAEEQPIQS